MAATATMTPDYKTGGTRPFDSPYNYKSSSSDDHGCTFKSSGSQSPFRSSSIGKLNMETFTASQQDAMADKMSNNSEDSGIADWNDAKSVMERKQILEGQMSCDVIFYVGEKREKFGAHKKILSSRSDVFRHMFNGSDVHKSEFAIPDIPADCFWEVLKHVYCGEQKLQVLNVIGILYAADRYDLLSLRNSCLDFIWVCLEVNNVCYLLMEVHRYGYHKEEQDLLVFIRKNVDDVLQTQGITLLSRDMLNQIITFPDIKLTPEVKKQALAHWAKHHCEEKQQDLSQENLMDSLQDCLYVHRDNSSHRYVMDAVTTRNVMARYEEPIEPVVVESENNGNNDENDSISTSLSSSSKTRSSVHTNSALPNYNNWADLDQVTRLIEVYGSDENDGTRADAISFTVDRCIYLYGFSVYGPKKDGEGRYKVDTVLTRKKKDIVMESIQIKGAGVILPVMFERPVKIDSKTLYTLEVYITGPASHMGISGMSKVSYGDSMFTFTKASKIKKNRTTVDEGQIPRLYFMPRNKK